MKLSMVGKISADNVLKYFLIFPQKICFDIGMKFSGKNINLLPAELAQKVVKDYRTENVISTESVHVL